MEEKIVAIETLLYRLLFDSLESAIIGSGWATRRKKKVILENAAPLRVRVCLCAYVWTWGSFNGRRTRARSLRGRNWRVKGPRTKHSLVHASAYKSLVGQA